MSMSNTHIALSFFAWIVLAPWTSFASGGVEHPQAPFVVISDYDDTVKIANTGRTLDMIRRSLFSSEAFAGASAIANAWVAKQSEIMEAPAPATAIKFVSASPILLHPFIERFFNVNNFPARSLYLWNPLRDLRQEQHKRRLIHQLVAEQPHNVVCVGDDMQVDPEIYRDVQTNFPGARFSTYIHIVRGRGPVGGQAGFVTYFELATKETQAGRIAEAFLARIGEEILQEKQETRIIPHFAYCPIGYRACTGAFLQQVPSATTLCERIEQKVSSLCRQRKAIGEAGVVDLE